MEPVTVLDAPDTLLDAISPELVLVSPPDGTAQSGSAQLKTNARNNGTRLTQTNDQP